MSVKLRAFPVIMPPVILPRVLAAASWLVTVCFFAWFALLRQASVGDADGLMFTAFGILAAGCTATVFLARHTRWRLGPWVAIALVAPFFAVTLFAHPPVSHVLTPEPGFFRGFTSDDYQRFLLDGELIVAGQNPYHIVPAEIPETSPHFRAATYVNHPDLATFYSPLAEAWFAVLAATGLGRNGLVLGNLAAIALVILLLARMGAGKTRLLLFALSPLLILESTIGYHFDPMVMFLLLGLAWCLTTGRRTGAAAFWAAAVGLKLFPLLLAPIVLRRVGWRRMAVAVAALAVLHIPFLNRQTLEVYRTFAEMVYNPSPIATLLPPWLKLAVLLGVVGWFTRRPGPGDGAVFWPILTVILISNTVHPWYVLWILPLAFLAPRTRWPVIGWSYAVVAAYAILIRLFQEGISRADPPVTTVVWLIFLAALALAGGLRIRRRRYSGRAAESACVAYHDHQKPCRCAGGASSE